MRLVDVDVMWYVIGGDVHDAFPVESKHMVYTQTSYEGHLWVNCPPYGVSVLRGFSIVVDPLAFV